MTTKFIQVYDADRSHYGDYVNYKFYTLLDEHDSFETYNEDDDEYYETDGVRFGYRHIDDDGDESVETVDIICTDSDYNIFDMEEAT